MFLVAAKLPVTTKASSLMCENYIVEKLSWFEEYGEM